MIKMIFEMSFGHEGILNFIHSKVHACNSIRGHIKHCLNLFMYILEYKV